MLIGSGVSANSQDDHGNRPPTWYEFLEKAKSELDTCPRYVTQSINSNKYLESCEYLKNLLGNRWNEIIAESFQSPGYKPAGIHRHIFNLDCRVVASLNFDKIYDAYASAQTQGTYIVKNYYDDDVARVSSGIDRYLLKLHGSIDTPNKLIFSTTDYARARNKYHLFYRVLDALVVTNTFLIIGCGVNDPDIQLIFENYRYSYDLENHFMVQARPVKAPQKELLLNSRGINVLEYSSANYHQELTDSLKELVSLVSDRRDDIASHQNW
ncbi:MAG: SIR2 family protein [Nitratireductor sp.]|nr:SIR2 family protein [Nitratireductor sp.]